MADSHGVLVAVVVQGDGMAREKILQNVVLRAKNPCK